jgi:AcrR family transcriptional regulator
MTGRPGRPASITREQVIDTAVRLAEQEGLDRFTMGQLATELGVAPMTAYHHVASRDALAGLVVERLLDRVEIPGPEDGPWDVQLKLLEANVRRELGSVRGISTSLKTDVGAAPARLADAVLAILDRAGFDEPTALLAFGAMFTYMVGQLDLDIATRTALDHTRDSDSDGPADDRFAELFGRTASDHRPDPDELFDFGFDLLLTGLRQTLQAAISARPPASHGQ